MYHLLGCNSGCSTDCVSRLWAGGQCERQVWGLWERSGAGRGACPSAFKLVRVAEYVELPRSKASVSEAVHHSGRTEEGGLRGERVGGGPAFPVD